jgi:hypothetical protein
MNSSSSMRQLRLTYGFKGPERDDVLRQSMTANQDKVILDCIRTHFFLKKIHYIL